MFKKYIASKALCHVMHLVNDLYLSCTIGRFLREVIKQNIFVWVCVLFLILRTLGYYFRIVGFLCENNDNKE